MKYENLDKIEIEKKAEILKTIGHPARLCMLLKLTQGPKNVSEMQNCLNMPQSTVSQHLAMLRTKGLIRGERRGTEVVYHISDDLIRDIVQVLF